MSDAVDDSAGKVVEMRQRRRRSGAAEALPEKIDDPEKLDEPDDRGDGPPEETSDSVLPAGCPVTPLGHDTGTCYYLCEAGQLRNLSAKDHSRNNLIDLFGRRAEYVFRTWPRKQQMKETGAWIITGFKAEECGDTLRLACKLAGVWSPVGRVRGAGAWRGVDDELVLHAGDALLTVRAGDAGVFQEPGALPWIEGKPGIVGRQVYPTAPSLPRPSPAREPQDSAEGAGAKMLRMLGTWSLRRPGIDDHLVLGWIGAAMLGGALGWRPVMWITGAYNTGKSSMDKLVDRTLGAGTMLHTSDASAAGVRQVLGHDSRPVAIDEAEADTDGRKMKAMVELARSAATGALAIRGGSDHKATQFTLRSCFLFSSILIPPLLPQDRSRIAVIELDALGSSPPPDMSERTCAELGARLLRQLTEQWHRYDATCEAYRDAMARAGHSSRGQDVYGTLLACADLLLYDHPPDGETLDAWCDKMAAEGMAEIQAQSSDNDACLRHLLTTPLEAPRDRLRFTVADWIRRAIGTYPGMDDDAAAAALADRVLQEAGVKVCAEDGGKPIKLDRYLAVASSHRGLSKIYAGTQWADAPGAQGVWVQSLRRLPHLVPLGANGKPKAIWIGSTVKATLLPLALCLPAPPDRADEDPSSAASPDRAERSADDTYSIPF
ncbi:MAG TPA: hypothetical protein VNT30_09310 [Stellaceae bacterium]|nr:hypothetical protein [Stellaceae bacterium]